MKKMVLSVAALGVLALWGLLYITPGLKIDFANGINGVIVKKSAALLDESMGENSISSTVPEATEIGTPVPIEVLSKNKDIEPQKPLSNPPAVIKAIYATGWSAGSPKKVDYLLNLIKSTELNAVVIDIKDYSGHVLYDTQNQDVIRYGAKEIQIARINEVIKRFHDEGIYVIAREVVFQDPILAKARPDLAVQRMIVLSPAVVQANGTSTTVVRATSTKLITWTDSKGLAWIDPGAKDAWDYDISIAKDAAARGFDEINFDYVRFPSDGAINVMHFNHYDAKNTLKITQLKKFFEYLRGSTSNIKISADLFGLVTVNNDDLGIGQNLKAAAPYFDAIAPMVYPSHFAKGFDGYRNPAAYPGDVVTYSMEQALKKLILKTECRVISGVSSATSTVKTSSSTCEKLPAEYMNAKLRPWLQDFNLGAKYDAAMVRSQINAVDKIVKTTPVYDGWMIWNPSNVYTQGALEVK